jgi:hypothetical protein
VLVRYSPSHDVGQDFEIVYNHADIDGSAIIWARDMGDAGNRELIEHYPERRFWLLDPDAKPYVLSPYPGP